MATVSIFGFDNGNRNPSIVNNGRLYDFVPCPVIRQPDYYSFYGIGVPIDDVPKVEMGLVTIKGCNNLGRYFVIPYKDITPNSIATSVTCAAPVAKVMTMTCIEASCQDWDRMTLHVVRPYTNCSSEYIWKYIKVFDNDCSGETTCALRTTAFAAYINADPTAPFTAVANNGLLTLTSKVVGDTWIITGYEAFNNVQTTVSNVIQGIKGDALKTIITPCASTITPPLDATCIYSLSFEYIEAIPDDQDIYGGSARLANSNHSLVSYRKTFTLFVDSTSTTGLTAYNELASILTYAKTASLYHAKQTTIGAVTVPPTAIP